MQFKKHVNAKKKDDDVCLKPPSRKKLYQYLALLVLGLISAFIFFFGTPLIGFEPIEPIEGTISILIGIFIGSGLTMVLLIIVVRSRIKKN